MKRVCYGVMLFATVFICLPLYGKVLSGFIVEGTTLVPLRSMGTELGAAINYDKNTQKVTISYKEQEAIMYLGQKSMLVNGEKKAMEIAPIMVEGTMYVPLRVVGTALGGQVEYNDGKVSIMRDQVKETWTLQVKPLRNTDSSQEASTYFSKGTKRVNNKNINYVMVNMSNPKLKVEVHTAKNRINRTTTLEEMAKDMGAMVSVNGTYFHAYNNDVPIPDGVVIKNGEPHHLTDIGMVLGFTPDNKVLMDFVRVRVKGYVNGTERWESYRINRPAPDSTATIIYTDKYEGPIPARSGADLVVCQNGKIIGFNQKIVPKGGFILDTYSSFGYEVGDSIDYEVTYSPENTSEEVWKEVKTAISAGPSLMLQGKVTGAPADESFKDPKIVTNSAFRTFIGVTKDNQVFIGTTSATIPELKQIAKSLGLVNAMCLDGGASSGIYYNGSYVTKPGRNINNSIHFISK